MTPTFTAPPTLLDQPTRQKAREHHYWKVAPMQAVRQGNWKAYRAAPGKPIELCNLATDLGEKHGMAKFERLLSLARTESVGFPLAGKTKTNQQP